MRINYSLEDYCDECGGIIDYVVILESGEKIKLCNACLIELSQVIDKEIEDVD